MTWKVNLKSRTAINDLGLIFEFKKNTDATWEAQCCNPEFLDEKILSGEMGASDCARMAREAADAYLEETKK